MHAVDEEVLSRVHEWLTQGSRCWLATVIGTWGSSPRPVGSLLGCDPAGNIVGSLSGGCVEDDLLEKLTRGELAAEQAVFFTYGVNAEESEKFGLPCGGSLLIVVEPLHPDDTTCAHFAHLRARLEARQPVTRIVDLNAGSFRHQDVDQFSPLRWDESKQILEHTLGPRNQLFIIGAGMVSKYLAQMASNLDYQITVCDPRKHLLEDFGVPGVTLVADMPDDAIAAHASDRASAIVALTHDPRIDDMGLMQALTTDAFYIGAMGSSRTSANRRERLKQLDLTDTQIDRLHAPIGISIGSKTPPEIAVSILAEITAVRAGVIPSRHPEIAAQAVS